MVNAPSNSYNWAGMGIKPFKSSSDDSADYVDRDKPVQPTYLVKYSSHDSNVEVDEDEDTANIGGVTTIIGYDRKGVSSSPEITTNMLFGEGLEQNIYGALGGLLEKTDSTYMSGEKDITVSVTTSASDKNNAKNYPRYMYVFEPTSKNRAKLPLFTETKGFNFWEPKTEDTYDYSEHGAKPKIMDNLMVDTLTLKMEADGDITSEVSYKGDAPIYNVAKHEATKTTKQKSSRVGQGNITIYYGSPDTVVKDPHKDTTALNEAKLVSTSCVNELQIEINNNLDDSKCFNSKFGVNTYDVGNFECEITGTFELNRKLTHEEAQWITSDEKGYFASEESYIRQILVCIEGVPILDNEGNKIVNTDGKVLDYKLFMSFPKVNISEWKPSEDGDDTATIEFTGHTILSTGATDGNVDNAPCTFTCYSTENVLNSGTEYDMTGLDGKTISRGSSEYIDPVIHYDSWRTSTTSSSGTSNGS